jgi:hypothetical protein
MMRLHYPDYIKLLKEDYQRKRKDIRFSSLLAGSTPAKIKKACIQSFKTNYQNRDERTLREFFGMEEAGRKFPQLIERTETTKFKPLDNYLKGATENTDPTNLELLAWLIDFQHRPWVLEKDVELTDDERAILFKDLNEAPVHPPEPNPTTDRPSRKHGTQDQNPKQEPGKVVKVADPNTSGFGTTKKKNKFIIAALITASIAGGGYILQQSQATRQSQNSPVGCMYWAGTHYEPMPCNEERKDRLKLPLDTEKMKNFKRITQEDTISPKSIGIVHYIRMNGVREYYTAGGNHPVEVTRSLHKLSQYMFDTHLKKKWPEKLRDSQD